MTEENINLSKIREDITQLVKDTFALEKYFVENKLYENRYISVEQQKCVHEIVDRIDEKLNKYDSLITTMYKENLYNTTEENNLFEMAMKPLVSEEELKFFTEQKKQKIRYIKGNYQEWKLNQKK